MAHSKYDLILHPVRLQILHALHGERHMTMEQLRARLNDVSPAVLSTQVDVLLENGVLVALDDGPEPVYRVGDANIPAYDRRRATPEDHIRYFTTFVAGLIRSFSRYVKRPDADVVRDRITYRQGTVFLTDTELATLLDDIETRLDQEEDDPSHPGRKPFVFSWVVMPEVQERDEQEG